MFSLAESFRRKRYEAGYREGLRLAYEDKRAEFNEEWQAWNERKQDALSKSLPFDEPPPVFTAREPSSIPVPPSTEIPTSFWLAESFLRKRYEAGRRQGRKEVDAAWEAWLERRQAAQSKGEPFDEPPPFRRSRDNGR